MTNTTAKLAARGFEGRAAEAAALVIDQGLSRREAAGQVGVDAAAVSRLLKKLTVSTPCPCCGHLKKEIKL